MERLDKDTLRLLLLAVGAVVMIGMYLWGRYKDKAWDFLHRRKEFEDLGFNDIEAESALDDEGDDPFEHRLRDRKEPRISGGRLPGDGAEDDDLALAEPAPQPAPAALGAPPFIQISVVASRGQPFRGEELRDALLDLDLIFGDMDIFHRYDRQFKNTLFSVATLVEPGTFPMDDIDGFECPGIILFFQTARVSDPLSVYDDLIATSRELATRLNGVEWDEARQPLSPEKIAETRSLLRAAQAQA
jgi:cell division protein ZipA